MDEIKKQNDIEFDELELLFQEANELFLTKDIQLIRSKVSERTLCGALMIQIHDLISKNSKYKEYYVDVEYNRNQRKIKEILVNNNIDVEVKRVQCDLIVHSRGQKQPDNLIAIEMKKSNTSKTNKEQDKIRLCALTSSRENTALFEKVNFVCNYLLGIYYEINFGRQTILVEHYKEGQLKKRYSIGFTDDGYSYL